MGLSPNGSMGLGGHGEGFEQQNDGQVRRNPEEGPNVNGGRSQSQEMDSMDQPQYIEEAVLELIDDPDWSVEHGTFGTTDPKTGDVKVQISGRHPMDVLRTIAHELSHSNHGDSDGHTGSDQENRANAEAGEMMRVMAEEDPEMFRETTLGIQDSDVLDTQDPFVGSQETGDRISEESGEEREYHEHGRSLRKLGMDKKSSRRIARAIASDHRKEDTNYYRRRDEMKITLKEFFQVNEMGIEGESDVDRMARLGWEWKNGEYHQGNMVVKKLTYGAGSTADEESSGGGEWCLAVDGNVVKCGDKPTDVVA